MGRLRFVWLGKILLLLLLLGPHSLSAQEPPVEPPRGFREILLGITLEEVKEKLLADPLFDYRGDPDVSFLPVPEQTLIECRGNSFIHRAYFQFHQQQLYIMILALDPKKLDYFTLYSTLTEKYGNPDSLDPSEAVWDFEGIRFSLERPLSVKYIAWQVFEALREQARGEEDRRALSKENFLKLF